PTWVMHPEPGALLPKFATYDHRTSRTPPCGLWLAHRARHLTQLSGPLAKRQGCTLKAEMRRVDRTVVHTRPLASGRQQHPAVASRDEQGFRAVLRAGG